MTKTSRRISIFAGIWALLFVTTLAIRLSDTTTATATENASIYNDIVQTNVQARMEGMPRHSTNVDDINRSVFDTIFSEIGFQIAAHNDPIYDCLSDAVSRSKVRTNYFEISFVVSPRPNLPTTDRQLTLANIIVERSTLPFTEEDERCLQRELTGLLLNAGEFPTGRVAYPMCITRRLDS